MAADQTMEAPPSLGSTILANIGCTRNSNSAERNSVAGNSAGASRSKPAAAFGVDATRSRMVIAGGIHRARLRAYAASVNRRLPRAGLSAMRWHPVSVSRPMVGLSISAVTAKD
jgi:hypothetical protein